MECVDDEVEVDEQGKGMVVEDEDVPGMSFLLLGDPVSGVGRFLTFGVDTNTSRGAIYLV